MKIIRQIVVDDVPTEETGLILREKLVNVMLVGGLTTFINFTNTGEIANHSFTLNGAFDWELSKDIDGRILLIPLRK